MAYSDNGFGRGNALLHIRSWNMAGTTPQVESQSH